MKLFLIVTSIVADISSALSWGIIFKTTHQEEEQWIRVQKKN
jgi:hypothetical protein